MKATVSLASANVASFVRGTFAGTPAVRRLVVFLIACVGYQANAQVVTTPVAPVITSPVVAAPVVVQPMPVFPEMRASNMRDLRRMRRGQLPLVYPTNQTLLAPAVSAPVAVTPVTPVAPVSSVAPVSAVQQTSYSVPVGSTVTPVPAPVVAPTPAPVLTPTPVLSPIPPVAIPVPVMPATTPDVFVPFF